MTNKLDPASVDQSLLARVQKLSSDAQRKYTATDCPEDQATLTAMVLDSILRETNYNLLPLCPFFYPDYLTDHRGAHPLSFSNRAFAWDLMALHLSGSKVVRGSRQIGKSTLLAAMFDMLCHLVPGFKTLYVAPYPDQVKTFADRFQEMADMNILRRAKGNPPSGVRENLYYREYPHPNSKPSTMKLVNVLTTAHATRGNSSTALIYDEAQGFDSNLETEVDMVVKATPNPIRMYMGTSLTTDSFLEAKFNESSRGYWHIYCPACHHWSNTGDVDQVYKMMEPNGICCAACSRPVNAALGQWVHEHPQRYELGDVGLHVAQIIVPENLVGDKWLEICKLSRAREQKQFMQEILGIPTADGAREITISELERICVLNQAEAVNNAKQNKYAHVVSGCDWGGSDYNPAYKLKQSYTVHAVIGITPDGTFDILHMRKYAGMNYESIVDDIMDNHKRLGGKCIASDYGVGAAYNNLIRKSEKCRPQDHFIMMYVGPRSKFMALPNETVAMPNMFCLNKVESISWTFQAIKDMRFRCYQWALASECLMDLTCVIRAPQESDNGPGQMVFRRHGSKPDDTLHAINFAVQIGRLLINESLNVDADVARLVKAQAGGASASPSRYRAISIPGR